MPEIQKHSAELIFIVSKSLAAFSTTKIKIVGLKHTLKEVLENGNATVHNILQFLIFNFFKVHKDAGNVFFLILLCFAFTLFLLFL